VIKAVAADPSLLRHRGPVVTFEHQADLDKRIDDPEVPVTPDSVLVLKRAGPFGGPGMPEWGMLPIPWRPVLLLRCPTPQAVAKPLCPAAHVAATST